MYNNYNRLVCQLLKILLFLSRYKQLGFLHYNYSLLYWVVMTSEVFK